MVKIETVDQIVRALKINRIDLFKIDVEGFELDVLKGAYETLARVDRLVLEYHSNDLARRTAELLTSRGFSIALDEKDISSSAVGVLFAKRRGDTDSGRSAVKRL
jgi:hypothetical protein